MDVVDLALEKIEGFERSIPWMYRDASGRVRVGVGMTVTDAAAAERLPFQVGERTAEAGEAAEAFARVETMPMGRAAQFYQRPGGPELSGEAMERLARAVIDGLGDELAVRVKGFAGMPDEVKVALLDMAYSLGLEGLVRGCPRVIRAVEAGAWGQAAAGSFRHGAGAERNEWTRKMFLANATGAQGDGRLKRLGYGCVGMLASWIGK